MNMARRGLLGLGMATFGSALVGRTALADPIDDILARASGTAPELAAAPPAAVATAIKPVGTRALSVVNLHTGESVKAVYWEEGAYVSDALSAMNKVLRDYRTGDTHPIDVRLLDTLTALHAKLDVSGPIEVISAYRSPATNGALSAKSGQVAKRSLHMDGKAMDIRVAGRDLTSLRRAALDLGRGGVGYYPVSNFVHVDVGAVRRWSGT